VPTPGDFFSAFVLVFKMVICAAIAFAGGYMILSALFSRKVSGREAFLLTAVLFALVFVCVRMALVGGPGIILLFAVVGGGAVVFHLLARASDRRLTRRLDQAEIARYEEALYIDPDNTAAHSLLADAYRERGETERAIGEYESALRLQPSLRQERYWLERLKAQLERGGQKEFLCPRCRTPRPERSPSCPECGRVYSAWEVWRHTFSMMEPARQAVLTGVGVGAAGLAFAILVLVPGAAKLIGVIAVLIAPLVVFMLTARAGGKTK